VKSLVASGLDGLCPEVLSDDDRKDLRCITGRIGSLLRPPASLETGVPAAQEKADDPDTDVLPNAPPEDAPSADVQAAPEADPSYPYPEALLLRVERALGGGSRSTKPETPAEGA